MRSAVVTLLPGVLINQSPNPRCSSPKIRSVAVKQCSKIHALQARPGQRPTSRAIFSLPDLQCLYRGLPRFEFSLNARARYGMDKLEMPENCIGDVIDDPMQTIEKRAQQALDGIEDFGKKSQASRCVSELKNQRRVGNTTKCLLYNATGDTIRYVDRHDSYNTYNTSLFGPGYPKEIGNDQWAYFLSVHQKGRATGTIGAVVCRGKTRQGQDRDLLLAWSSPWSWVYRNKAYCEVGDVNFCNGRWDAIYNRMMKSSHTSTWTNGGVKIHAEIGTGGPTFTAVISQE